MAYLVVSKEIAIGIRAPSDLGGGGGVKTLHDAQKKRTQNRSKKTKMCTILKCNETVVILK